MTTPTLVPFGKYKGQPVESLAQDKAYCEWLASQEWFRTKFTTIHTLIINQFTEPTATPEHNALQARFLDNSWCQRFALAVGEPDPEAITKRSLSGMTKYIQLLRGDVAHKEKNLAEWYRKGGHGEYIANLENELRKIQAALADAEREQPALCDRLLSATWRFSVWNRDFEHKGQDVVFNGSIKTDEQFPLYNGESLLWRRLEVSQQFAIECKPLLGDDYPAVLRQMKASEADYLLVEDVRSAVVSLDQIRQFFMSAAIDVLTVAEVEQQSLRWPEEKARS